MVHDEVMVDHLRTVALVVQDGVETFGLGVLSEVWNEPYHPDDDNPVFDFRVCAPRPGRIAGHGGYDLHVEHGLEATHDADLVCFVPRSGHLDFDPAVLECARDAHARGATVFAHCTATFMLAEAGLLDGRACTTHWRHADELARLYPQVEVRPDILYVDEGDVVTGAGSAASIDASLHVMRRHFGARVAATAARRIVVPPHRDGGQAQFVRTPMQSTDVATLAPLLDWMTEHLGESLSVDRLAARAHMSARTFARRFRDETGTTPLQWLTTQRVALTEELLEGSGLSIDQIADRVGFGNAATLRHHFVSHRGITPQHYRRTFCGVPA